jgi:hypothetical protein
MRTKKESIEINIEISFYSGQDKSIGEKINTDIFLSMVE